MNKLNILLVGNGKFGKHYLNICSKFPNINLAIADRKNWRKLLPSSDGVIIATPVSSHKEILKSALTYSVPILCEKPLVSNSYECQEVADYMYPNNILLVDYIHLFAPAFKKIQELLQTRSILAINSIGCNRGPYRENCNSLLDYGVHELAMSMYLSDTFPQVEYCLTEYRTTNDKGDNYNVCIDFGQFKHYLTCGSAGPDKKRYFEVICSNGDVIEYDDVGYSKLKMNGQSISIGKANYLENVVECFLGLIEGKKDDRAGIELSLKVHNIIDNCENMLV